jgi:hypothetical protein
MNAAYEYEVGQRAEVKEYGAKEYGAWLPVTIVGRFIGPESGWPIYIIAGASDRDRYRYGIDLRPVSE